MYILKIFSALKFLFKDYEDLKAETLSEKSIEENDLNALVLKLQEQTKVQQQQLQQACEDMEKMRKAFHRLVQKEESTEEKYKTIACVSSMSLKADEGYFDSYAHFGIHHEMLSVFKI